MSGILISGCRGLIGSALAGALRMAGRACSGIDLRGSVEAADHGDVRDADLLARRIASCEGVVHLAAISRVVWGQRAPALCWETNVTATQRLASIEEKQGSKGPFVLVTWETTFTDRAGEVLARCRLQGISR